MDDIKLVSGKSNGREHEFRRKSPQGTSSGAGAVPGKDKGAVRKAAPAKKSGNGGKKAIIITAVSLAVICAAFFALSAYVNSQKTIFPHVSMESVNISGLTASDAADALVAANVGTDDSKELSVNLPAGCELKINAGDAGCYMGAADAAAYAYNLCHNGNFAANTLTYVKCLFSGMTLTLSSGATINESFVREKTDEAAKQVALALMHNSVDIGKTSVTIVKGASSVQINADNLYKTVLDALKSGNLDTIDYKADSSGTSDGTIDLKSLYDTVYEAPANAEYDPNTHQATADVVGRSFDMKIAQTLWNKAKNGDKVVIPLILTPPDITTEKLNSMLFADLLSQKSTSLGGSSSARINNIKKAAAALNGKVLNPGEEFSYNNTLGQRTAAAGYQMAGAYSGGQVVTEIGGGICQVSSTLYYCTLYANLSIVSRINHYFGVNYLPAGLDATVSWPSPDFKFKNSSAYPIKIVAYVDMKSYTVTVQLYGSNPDGTTVKMDTATTQLSDGYSAVSYRSIYDKSGSLVSKKKEATSRYYYHTEASPTPSATPVPSSAPASPAPTVAPSPSHAVSPSAPESGTPKVSG